MMQNENTEKQKWRFLIVMNFVNEKSIKNTVLILFSVSDKACSNFSHLLWTKL